MPKFTEYWGKQFAYPHGLGGKIATFLMNRINKKMNKAIFENVPQEGNILDIGFGCGSTLQQLSKRSKAVFFGVDISPDMVKAAKKRNKKAVKSGRLTLVEGAADAIPFGVEFDCIYTSNTVYFWQDLTAGLNEIRSKLKAAGIFLNVFRTKEWLDKSSGTKDYAKYELAELQQATTNSGFTTEVIPITDGTFMIKAIKQ